MRRAKSARVVFDASAVVRAVVDGDPSARGWLRDAAAQRLEAAVPELLFAEVAQALTLYVRAARQSRDDATAALRVIAAIPADVATLRDLAAPALGVALERGLSAYDGCYVALAEARGATLVTADRRLATAVSRSALLPDARPPV